jgi:hypothetical protein
MKAGAPNENAQYFLFSELGRRQPVSLSESSALFNTSGNARIFYLLKQFALRSIGSAVQDAKRGFDNGDIKGGILKAVSLVTILGLAGAGTDEIKRLILGRERVEDLPDAVVSNIMELLFINRYSVETGLKQGRTLQNVISNNIMLPPVRLMDDMVKDIYKTMQGDFSYKTMAHVPMFGRMAFDYTPQGREADLKRQRRFIMEQIAEGVSPGKLRAQINRFNQETTGEEGTEKITGKSITSARKRARENE